MTDGFRQIETHYGGCYFRSRREARWAVFFDSLQLNWEYEPQGYVLPEFVQSSSNHQSQSSLYYLPDFWLPDLQLFIEVKGRRPTDVEIEKALRLAQETTYPVYIFYDQIPHPAQIEHILLMSDSAYKLSADGMLAVKQTWCRCPICGLIGLAFCGIATLLPCACWSTTSSQSNTMFPHSTYADQKILRAYANARSARFDS